MDLNGTPSSSARASEARQRGQIWRYRRTRQAALHGDKYNKERVLV